MYNQNKLVSNESPSVFRQMKDLVKVVFDSSTEGTQCNHDIANIFIDIAIAEKNHEAVASLFEQCSSVFRGNLSRIQPLVCALLQLEKTDVLMDMANFLDSLSDASRVEVVKEVLPSSSSATMIQSPKMKLEIASFTMRITPNRMIDKNIESSVIATIHHVTHNLLKTTMGIDSTITKVCNQQEMRKKTLDFYFYERFSKSDLENSQCKSYCRFLVS